MRIIRLLKDNRKLIAYGFTLVILYLSLAKIPSPGVIEVNNADKIYHTIAYFALTFAWLYSYASSNARTFWITLSCVFFGIIIEGLQVVLTNYRSGDFLDILANTLGSLLALGLYKVFLKKT